MKKILLIALLLLTGCTSSSETSDQPKPDSIYHLDQNIKTNNWNLTISNKQIMKTYSDYDGFMTYSADGIFISFQVNATNISKNLERIDESDFYLTCNDTSYSVSSSLGNTSNNGLFFKSANPGNSIQGVIRFDIPEEIANNPELTLHYKDLKILINK